MAKQFNRLTTLKIKSLTQPGRYSDGNGLYIQISANGGRRWIYRFTLNGRKREMGLGAVSNTPLAEARKRRDAARILVADGVDPIAARERDLAIPTFGEAAQKFIEANKKGWSNSKHQSQWHNTLQQHASHLTKIPVDQITIDDVLKVLEPIWTRIPETAQRLRARIERILDSAKARGWRKGENPARMRGNLDNWLSKPSKLQRGHHKALTYSDLPALMAQLREREAVSALALEFTILTAARTSEVINARWDEMDLEEGVWSVPAVRMKAKREHRVPLPPRAVAILRKQKELAHGPYVFPGGNPSKGLSNMAMSNMLKSIDKSGSTVHGFRSTFRDWTAEETDYPREIPEAALAHIVGDATERAYRRGDALEKRRKLMNDWEDFCTSATS